MKLPNAEHAIIDKGKIRDYCLNHDHPRGKHKARIFQSVLGMTVDDAETLISEIKNRVQEYECQVGEQDDFGQRYTVDMPIENSPFEAVIRTGWIIKRNEISPRLTTCYVK